MGQECYILSCPFINIQDWIDNRKGEHLKEEGLLSLFKQMCLGIRALVEYKNKGVSTPWAHRDVKPANVLLSDDGKTAVLMDFGSARKARIEIKDKRTAQQVQDEAAEHCSMPYRAPELFDVSAHNTIDEKIDIWSLGCTLYTMAYGESPFERTVRGGGSIGLAIMNGQYVIPGGLYSTLLENLISSMLQVNPHQRPTIHSILQSISEFGFK